MIDRIGRMKKLLELIGEIETTPSEEAIFSSPPRGYHRVHNIYGNKIDNKYHPVFEWEQEAES